MQRLIEHTKFKTVPSLGAVLSPASIALKKHNLLLALYIVSFTRAFQVKLSLFVSPNNLASLTT